MLHCMLRGRVKDVMMSIVRHPYSGADRGVKEVKSHLGFFVYNRVVLLVTVSIIQSHSGRFVHSFLAKFKVIADFILHKYFFFNLLLLPGFFPLLISDFFQYDTRMSPGRYFCGNQ